MVRGGHLLLLFRSIIYSLCGLPLLTKVRQTILNSTDEVLIRFAGRRGKPRSSEEIEYFFISPCLRLGYDIRCIICIVNQSNNALNPHCLPRQRSNSNLNCQHGILKLAKSTQVNDSPEHHVKVTFSVQMYFGLKGRGWRLLIIFKRDIFASSRTTVI